MLRIRSQLYMSSNDKSRHTEDCRPQYLHTLGNRFFAFAQNDEGNKILKQVQNDKVVIVQNDVKDKNRKRLINLSTYKLIDLKNVKTLVSHPSALIPTVNPISLSLESRKFI